MRDFLLKALPNGGSDFVDEADRATFQSLLTAFTQTAKARGIEPLFVMRVMPYESKSTNNQRKYFNILVDHISRESGEDISTITETLIANHSASKTLPENMTKTEFQLFFERCIAFAQDFFNLNITIDHNNHIQIKKVR